MADGFDTPPTQDEIAASQAPVPPEPKIGTDPDGAHPIDTSIDVKEPGGAAAPGPGGQEDPWASPPTAEEIEASKKPPTVNPAVMGFVAENGDLPKPDRAAEIIRYSVASGMPPNLVAANFDAIKQKVDAGGVDWKKLAERQPALAQYLAENPHAIPMAQEDHKNLGMIEWALGGHPFAAFMDAVHEQGTTALQFLRAEGVKGLDERIQQRLADEQASSQQYGPDYGAHNFITKGIIGTAKFVPYMALDKAARVLGAGVGLLAGGGAGAETGPGAAGTGLGGMALGQYISSGIFNYAEALGPLSWNLDHQVDANGQHINPVAANVAAQMGAAASGALMSGTMGLYTGKAAPVVDKYVQKALPGVEKAIQNVAESSVVKWLGDDEVRGAISKFLGRWGLHTAIGAGMMAANSAVTSAATEAAKFGSGSPGEVGAKLMGASVPGSLEARWGNIAEAAANGGAQAIKDLWLMSAVPAVQGALQERGLARASAEATARAVSAIDAAAKSTVLEKSPEAFQQIVQNAAPDAKYYVPAERWVSYFQDKKLDPAEAAKSVGLQPEELTNALSAGGDLAIPASNFLTALSKNGHAEGLAMDLKTSPELLTPREFNAKQEAETQRITKDTQDREGELNEGKKAIEDFVVSQAKASGLKVEPVRAGAKLMADAAATAAVRLNVSMQEAARLMNYGDLTLTGKEGVTPEHQQALKDFREWMAPSAAQELKARQATLSPENLARELYIDRNTGFTNERHFLAAKAEGKFANVSIEGTKFVNDTLDHERGDLLYRAAAKALNDAAPNAISKTGGDFELRVKDQAELDDILKRANNAMPDQLKGFNLTGALGETRESAKDAHIKLKTEAEASGARAKRGEQPKGFTGNIKETAFPTAKPRVEVNPELAAKVAAMKPEEYFREAYVEPKTGLLTNLGWQNIERRRWVASFDLKKLKLANQVMGDAGGDALIERFGKLATHYSGSSFDFAHLHGDEFAAQHDDPARLQAFVDRLYEKAKNVRVSGTASDGEPVSVPLGFRHGIGKGTYESADAALNRRKALEPQAETGPGQMERGQNDVARGDGGEGADNEAGSHLDRRSRGLGAGDAGRGGSGQDFPGASSPGREGFQEVVGRIEGRPVVFQQDPPSKDGAPRGEIRLDISESGRPRAFNIQILQGDKSTFLHEAAHFLSWSLHDLATSDLATDQVKEDYQTLLEFAGYKTPEERLQAITSGAGKTQEERISHGFEQYVAEGKSPSKGLSRVFSRFREWLGRIYKGVSGIQAQYRDRYGEEIGLSDDVRQVFNRLLAQDEALRQADHAVGGAGELKEAVAGMSAAEAGEYRRALADSKATADQEVGKDGDERQKQLDAQREAFRKQTTADLDRNQVYRAWRYLQNGDLPEVETGTVSPEQFKDLWTDENGKPFKMARGEFTREFGEDVAKEMPPNSLKARGGRPPEEIAARLGYQSAREMVEAMRNATPRDEAIERVTQDKMDAAHGPELERATEVALSGVHNPRDLDAAVMELRGFAKQINPELARQARAIDVESLRQNIDRLTSEKMVDQLDPASHARAERRLALEAAELWGKGEKEASYDKREQRLVSKLLFMSERDAKQELDKARKKLSSTSEAIEGMLGRAEPSFRDVHNAIIAAVKLGDEPPAGSKTLDDMLAVAQAGAYDIDFDVNQVRQLLTRPRNWDTSLPVEMARNVADAITNIRTVARRSLEVKLGGKMVDREELIQNFVKSVSKARPSQPKQGLQRSNESLTTKARLKLQAFDGALSDITTLAHMLDGGNREGPAHQLFIDERHAARDVVTKLTKQVLGPVMKKWEEMPKEVKELMSQDIDLSDLPIPESLGRFEDNRTRETLYMMFLNWGNEGNRQRLLDGFGWDQSAVERNLAKLKPEETDFLQTILDVTDGLYTPMADVHEADTGIRPEKVSASHIILNGKEYRGGYFPAKYDFRASRVGARQLATDIKNVSQVFAEANQRPAIGKSHAKERADAVKDAPLDLSAGVVASHLSNVINDIANRSYVKDTASILLDDRVRNVLEEKLGPERAKQFMPTLQTVANAQADSVPANLSSLQGVNRWFRNRMALQAVGWSFRSAAGVMTDPLSSLATGTITPGHLTAAWLKTWNPLTFKEVRDSAEALSPELQARETMRDSNLRNAFGEMLGEPKGMMQKLRDTAFYLHTVADRRNEAAVWTGKFNQGLAEGKSQEIAIRDADDAVRAVTPSYDPAEKAAILRSATGLSSILTFYSYTNKIYNLHRRNFDSAFLSLTGDKPTGEKAKDMAKFAGTAMALLVSHGMVAEYMTGRGKEDDETWAHWMMRKAITAPFNTLPLVGSVVESLVEGKKISVKNAPAMAFLEDTATRLQKLTKESTNETSEQKLLGLVETLMGFALGAPTQAVHRVIDTVQKNQTGEIRSRGPLDFAGGAIYGNSKARPANPLADLQTAISGK